MVTKPKSTTQDTSLTACLSSERLDLFKQKIQACACVYDFHSESKHSKEKETKRQTLLEIIEHVSNTRNCFNASLMKEIVDMVGANIFRALPSVRHRSAMSFSVEEEEPMLERSWPHLHLVYELFLRFLVSNDVDAKVAKRYVDQNFVLKLLELFDSEDPRERDYLKTIVHRVYGKFMSLRGFIRRAIQNTFFTIIYESEFFNGVAELLEILGSIINGFALPLKEEHKDFLLRALIPLHKVRSLAAFHQQLSYCMAQYIEKDPQLVYDIVMSMLKFWPVSMTSKQLLFLNELEETLELTQPKEFIKIQKALFTRLAGCITCPHFQISERILFFWNNDYIVKLINANRTVLFPLLITALHRNSKLHWNSGVSNLNFNVLKLLMETDSQLFEVCSARYRREVEEEEAKSELREARWSKLQALYEQRQQR